jgi:hypothetical protein
MAQKIDKEWLDICEESFKKATEMTPDQIVKELTDSERVKFATNSHVMQHGPKIKIRDNS